MENAAQNRIPKQRDQKLASPRTSMLKRSCIMFISNCPPWNVQPAQQLAPSMPAIQLLLGNADLEENSDSIGPQLWTPSLRDKSVAASRSRERGCKIGTKILCDFLYGLARELKSPRHCHLQGSWCTQGLFGEAWDWGIWFCCKRFSSPPWRLGGSCTPDANHRCCSVFHDLHTLRASSNFKRSCIPCRHGEWWERAIRRLFQAAHTVSWWKCHFFWAWDWGKCWVYCTGYSNTSHGQSLVGLVRHSYWRRGHYGSPMPSCWDSWWWDVLCSSDYQIVCGNRCRYSWNEEPRTDTTISGDVPIGMQYQVAICDWRAIGMFWITVVDHSLSSRSWWLSHHLEHMQHPKIGWNLPGVFVFCSKDLCGRCMDIPDLRITLPCSSALVWTPSPQIIHILLGMWFLRQSLRHASSWAMKTCCMHLECVSADARSFALVKFSIATLHWCFHLLKQSRHLWSGLTS